MKLQVIIGTTRTGRATDRAAKWVMHALQQREGVQAELVDLADYPLSMLDEPVSPRYNPDRKPEGVVKQWLDKVAEADGYVIVTPEYNRSVAPALKNALDYLDFQFDDKPVALVAHGSTGGAQAVANLRMIVPGLNAVTVPSATFLLGMAGMLFEEDGTPKADMSGADNALKATLDSLVWYAGALSAAR